MTKLVTNFLTFWMPDLLIAICHTSGLLIYSASDHTGTHTRTHTHTIDAPLTTAYTNSLGLPTLSPSSQTSSSDVDSNTTYSASVCASISLPRAHKKSLYKIVFLYNRRSMVQLKSHLLRGRKPLGHTWCSWRVNTSSRDACIICYLISQPTSTSSVHALLYKDGTHVAY